MKTKYVIFLLSIFLTSLPVQANNIAGASQKMVTSQIQTEKSAKINLNTADVHTLTGSFKGIGAKRAAEIVKYRETHKFQNLEQLGEVKGIGKSFISRHLEQLKEVYTTN